MVKPGKKEEEVNNMPTIVIANEEEPLEESVETTMRSGAGCVVLIPCSSRDIAQPLATIPQLARTERTDEEKLAQIDEKYAAIAALKEEQEAQKSTIVCPVCGKSCDKNDLYCRICGEKLQ